MMYGLTLQRMISGGIAHVACWMALQFVHGLDISTWFKLAQ